MYAREVAGERGGWEVRTAAGVNSERSSRLQTDRPKASASRRFTRLCTRVSAPCPQQKLHDRPHEGRRIAIAMTQSTPTKALRFQKHLGAGVFGNVYKAYDVVTGSMYAAKMTKYNAAEPQKGLNEIQILKYIQHHKDAHGGSNETIVSFVDSFIHHVSDATGCSRPSYRCILMEYVGPLSLRDALERDLIVDVDIPGMKRANGFKYTIKQVMADVLGAIDFIHALNIVHRDIKPENIICRVSNQRIVRVVLADFGCSKRLMYNSNSSHLLSWKNGQEERAFCPFRWLKSEITKKNDAETNVSVDFRPSNPVVCTRLYRSPELLLGSSYCVLASDMFSVGKCR